MHACMHGSKQDKSGTTYYMDSYRPYLSTHIIIANKATDDTHSFLDVPHYIQVGHSWLHHQHIRPFPHITILRVVTLSDKVLHS